MGLQRIPIKFGDLQENAPVAVDVNGKRILVVLIGGAAYAMDAVCSHRGGPLEAGVINGHEVTCPWHSARFDVQSGKASKETPWGKDLRSYKVSVDEKTGEMSVAL